MAAAAYVEGRLAAEEQDLATAGDRYAAALKLAPDDELLRRRALEIAILAGDAKAAFSHANALEAARRQGDKTPSAASGNPLVVLTVIASAAADRAWRVVEEVRPGFVEPQPRGDSSPVLAAIIEAWSLAARGQADAAIARLDVSGATGISASYVAEHLAAMHAWAGNWPQAAGAYARLVAAEGANVPRLRIAAAGAALEAAKTDPAWRERAITLLAGGAANDPLLMDARARYAKNPGLSGHSLGMLVTSPEQGLSLLFLRVAADIGRERSSGAALHFARLATFISPKMPEAWLVTADNLLRQQQPELAIAAIDHIGNDAPWARLATARRVAALAQLERWSEARALLAPILARPDSTPEDIVQLADLERRAANHPAAAARYAEALAAMGDAPAPVRAQLNFMIGASQELAGNWAAAEPALRNATMLQPDNPTYLNYLGYGLLDRRQQVPAARAMIARAYAAMPENGAIIDSMGWAAYVSGDYAEAVRLLEQARAAEPSDPTVADHLGDALWRVGRRIEARHAWNSARALEPDSKLAAALAAKLDIGLDAIIAAK